MMIIIENKNKFKLLKRNFTHRLNHIELHVDRRNTIRTNNNNNDDDTYAMRNEIAF